MAIKKTVKHLILCVIHPETFTSLIEFVKNYLVKLKSLCHYQSPYHQFHQGPIIVGYLNQITEYL